MIIEDSVRWRVESYRQFNISKTTDFIFDFWKQACKHFILLNPRNDYRLNEAVSKNGHHGLFCLRKLSYSGRHDKAMMTSVYHAFIESV